MGIVAAVVALELTGLVSQAWTNRLVSDGEKPRRTTQPRTSRTPWIMSGELNQPELLAQLPALTEKFRPEPVGPFPGWAPVLSSAPLGTAGRTTGRR